MGGKITYYDKDGNPINDCKHDWQRRTSNWDASGEVLWCPKCRCIKAAKN